MSDDLQKPSPEILAALRKKFELSAARKAAEIAEGDEYAGLTVEQETAALLRVEWLREAFEKWATRSGHNVERATCFVHHFDQEQGNYAPHGIELGVYVDFTMELAWCAFLAGDHVGRAT